MRKDRIFETKDPSKPFNTVLEETLREGARRLLQQAIENEVQEFLQAFENLMTDDGRKRVVRNGCLPERKIQTGVGPIPIKGPRVRDKEGVFTFTSTILPPYMRRTPSIEAVVSALYLKGVSTSSFPEALEALLGENAKGLSPTNIVRLKESWETEYKEWNKRNLSNKHFVYIWVDGIYFNVRLDEDRPCLLVIIGALSDGSKEIVTIHDGFRESKSSWAEALQDLKSRGLSLAPALAIGDGALGFWAALEEIFPETKAQRCWVHKTANVLDKLPKSAQNYAKTMLLEIYMAETKERALRAFDAFLDHYGAKYPKACECLKKDKAALLTFYDFPDIHWQHIRTTNPIESTFATVRHRTRQTKGSGSRMATLTMVFKLATSAQKHWKKLHGYQLLENVIKGIRYRDGEEAAAA